MSLARILIDLLKVNKRFIIVYSINTGLLVLLIYLLTGFEEFVYPISVSFFILFVYLLYEAIKFYKLRMKMEDAKCSPRIVYDETNLEEQLIFNLTNNIHDYYHRHLYELNSQFKERNTLFSQWIHNMKVSIAVIDLAYEKGAHTNPELEFLEDIKEENEKLKVNLEECLNVLRLDDFSRDYIPEKVNVHSMVINVVNSKKRDFIYRGIFPKVEIDQSLEVYTDLKWCSYVIDQIVSNAIKYSAPQQNKTVTIKANKKGEEVILIVKDKGVGIAKEDLPRVFETFFTGSNGRINESATGIGLYMVKYISKKLGHTVSIASQKGEGTEVMLSFLTKV